MTEMTGVPMATTAWNPEMMTEAKKGALAVVVAVAADAAVVTAKQPAIHVQQLPDAVPRDAALRKAETRSLDAAAMTAADTTKAEIASAAGLLSSPSSKAVVLVASVAA